MIRPVKMPGLASWPFTVVSLILSKEFRGNIKESIKGLMIKEDLKWLSPEGKLKPVQENVSR